MSDTPQIIKIPISKIMPNEDQPRHRFQVGSIQEISDSMRALGQLDPAKVRPFTEAEKTSYTKSEIEWHKTGGGLPPTIGERGFEYLLIGGHRRREGALLAGFETLDCIVLNIAPEETHLTSLIDNNREEMDWWDWDLAIEAESKAFPNMTQRELAKRLGVSKSKVGKALLICKLLDDNDRYKIDMNLDPRYNNEGYKVDMPTGDADTEDNFAPPRGKTPSPDANLAPRRGRIKSDYRITESILVSLAKLKDPHSVCGAVTMIINHEMNEITVNKLIKWCNEDEANDPEYFDPQSASQPKTQEPDPLAEDWKDFDPGIKVNYKGGEVYEIHLTMTGGDKALKTARAAQKAIRGGIFSI